MYLSLVYCISYLIYFFLFVFFFLMIRRPPRSTPLYSSAASDVYKRRDWCHLSFITRNASTALAIRTARRERKYLWAQEESQQQTRITPFAQIDRIGTAEVTATLSERYSAAPVPSSIRRWSGRWPASRIATKVCATWLSPLSLQPTAIRTQDPPRCPQQWTFAVSKNAGAGTRTRTGVTLRFLRPLRLPFRHSGPQTRSLVSYSTSPATRPSRISRSETSKSRDPRTFIAVRSISPPATITSSLPSCMQGSPRRSRQVMDASRPTWLWISSRVRRAW